MPYNAVEMWGNQEVVLLLIFIYFLSNHTVIESYKNAGVTKESVAPTEIGSTANERLMGNVAFSFGEI